MQILLHTSKSMRPVQPGDYTTTTPQLLPEAQELVHYIRALTADQLVASMNVSPKLATSVQSMFDAWAATGDQLKPAIDSFIGDIYSGLQVQTWTDQDRDYAQATLRIISGLYGVLRPLDAIAPYRLEMGYRLPDEPYKSLYAFWGDKLSNTLAGADVIVDLTAFEYSKALEALIQSTMVVRPKFLTKHPQTGEPTFVVVHAKIARGAFASWLIKERIAESDRLKEFTQLNYRYNETLSTDAEPVYVCESFGGLGLSVRLT